ncbi:MAG: glutathione S-transferase family protein [Arenicellales bacterium]|nr:glutathione S-transferase family protein [Arenicellales bacterium]
MKLVFTAGSPGARAVRVVLDELDIEYEPVITGEGASSDISPALQVPCLVCNGLTLWETPVIIDYLLSSVETSDNRIAKDKPQLAGSLYRPSNEWDDKLALASVQTFGTSVATISQMRWAGVKHQDNTFLSRCAKRINHLLDWYENQIDGPPVGLFEDSIAIQDLILVCYLDFIDHRPLELQWRKPQRTNISTLFRELTARQTLIHNPIEWWEP